MQAFSSLLAIALTFQPPGGKAEQPGPAVGPIVTLPKTLTATVGDLVIVKAESGAELITWDASDNLTLVHPKPFDPAMKSIAIHASEPGEYALSASIPNGKETRVALCLVKMNPRGPPVVVPPVVVPPPTFAENLQTAFNGETAADKAKLADLASLYSEAGKSGGLAYDAKQLTAGQLHNTLKAARIGLIGESLPAVREVIRVEFDRILPTKTTAPLDKATRDTIAAAFLHVGDILKGLNR